MRIVKRPVTVASEGAAKAYDGTPLTHPVVTVGGSGFVTGECTATATGAQTAVGSSKNTVALAWADGASADNYTITRDEGTLTVTPRSVTVTTKSATKVFDGTPLRASGVTVGGSGFVAGECTATAAGAQTAVGSSKNTVALAWANGASAGNYTVTKSEGTLTVTPGQVAASGSEPGSGSVPSGGISKFDAAPVKYDGKGHTINVAALQAVTLAGSTPSFSYSLSKNGPFRSEPYTFTNAGETSLWYRVSAANYDDFVHEARVTILPREVTLTSGSASKNYDGTALTKKSFSVSGDGFVGAEGVTLTYTGSQLYVGSSANAFSCSYKSGTRAANYKVTKKTGTLTVTAAGVVAIPNGVASIPANAFKGCTGITRVRLPASVVTVGTGAFSGCTGITAVEIGRASQLAAFSKSQLRSIVFLDSVTEIPDGTLSGCTSLQSVTFPSTIRLRHSELTRMGLTDEFIFTFWRRGDFVIAGTSLVAYLGARNASALVVPSGIELIDDGAFAELYDLQRIEFCGTEREIGKGAFRSCNYLKAVELPDLIEVIGESAFEGCDYMSYFTFPPSLTEIGPRAFAGCLSLMEVSVGDGLVRIGSHAFDSCGSLSTLRLPASLNEIGDGAFEAAGGVTLRGATMPTHLLPLAEMLPAAYENIVEFNLPVGERTICDDMFAGCAALKDLVFSDVVSDIGERAFEGCGAIGELDIPDSVLTVGAQAFSGCTGLERIRLSRKLTAVSDGLFGACTKLVWVRFPESVLSVGARVFQDARDLERVYFDGNAPTVDVDFYVGSPDGAVTVVVEGSKGWAGTNSRVLPLNRLWMGRTIQWDENRISVCFDANGGTFDGFGTTFSKPQNTDTAYVIPEEIPVRAGYRFEGWYTAKSGGSKVDEHSVVYTKDDQTLYAHWEPATTVTVTFVPQEDGRMPGASVASFASGTTYGRKFLDYKPTRHGWAFDGWYTAAEAGAGDLVTSASEVPYVNTTLYAHWRVAKYKVIFDKNDGTGIRAEQSFTYNVWQALAANAYTWRDHAFLGWSRTPGYDGTIDFADGKFIDWNLAQDDGEEVVLFAQWSGDTYTVWFNSNGGTGDMASQTFMYGASLALRRNSFVRPGYEFAGWSLTGGDAAQVAFGETQALSETLLNPNRKEGVQLYAVWVHEGTSRITVRFVPGTGAQLAEGETETRQYRVGDTYASGGSDDAFPGAIRTGYVMTGWWTAATGGERIDETDRIRAAVTTLYAQWEPIVYTVRYDANGGSGKMSDQEFTYDVAQGLRPNGFSKANCVFDGWTLKNTSTIYVNGQSAKNLTTVPNGIVTLVARWRTVSAPTVTTYEVQLLPGEGSGAICILAFDPGRVYKLKLASELSFRPPTDKTRFAGWACSNGRRYDDGMLVFDLAKPGETVTMTAIWK